MFHFTWFRVIGPMNSSQCVLADGFPHSEILESTPDCGSSRLIAAYRVLHRLLTPRHSPFTLTSLEKSFLLPSSFYFFRLCAVFKEPKKNVFWILDRAMLGGALSGTVVPLSLQVGGPDWTRTSDPALIKRML